MYALYVFDLGLNKMWLYCSLDKVVYFLCKSFESSKRFILFHRKDSKVCFVQAAKLSLKADCSVPLH